MSTVKTTVAWEYTIKRTKAGEVAEHIKKKANAPDKVRDYLAGIGLHKEEREMVVLLCMDARNQVKAHYIVSIGTLTSSQVHPREVFRPAIIAASARVILAHNHPSGDPSPSTKDIGQFFIKKA